MDRMTFLKTCGLACLGAGYAISFLEGCSSAKHVTATIEADNMVLPLSAFLMSAAKGDKPEKYYSAIIADHPQLNDPICVFRNQDGQTYQAVLMRCTHQGVQLQVFGDKLQCPAHGSEFDKAGAVLQGPAADPLRSFPVSVLPTELRISLR
jgi:Rieske Fe-S protein